MKRTNDAATAADQFFTRPAGEPDITILNRRDLLAGLIGIGAAIALRVTLAEASAAEIDAIWVEQISAPYYFEIADYGTIVVSTWKYPKRRSELFFIDTARIKTAGDLIREVDGNWLIGDLFEQFAANESQDAQDNLDDESDDQLERTRLKARIAAIETRGWAGLVRFEGDVGLPRFVALLDEWLAGSASEVDTEFWPRHFGPQGEALGFFEALDREIREALGVVIVDGDQPGSSYFAAELRNDIADANRVAAQIGLPFMFRQEGG